MVRSRPPSRFQGTCDYSFGPFIGVFLIDAVSSTSGQLRVSADSTRFSTAIGSCSRSVTGDSDGGPIDLPRPLTQPPAHLEADEDNDQRYPLIRNCVCVLGRNAIASITAAISAIVV